MDIHQEKKLLAHFSNFITPDRLGLFQQVISNRTRHITVVLEDIYQPHNASAVLRTCDCFGIQDVHIIESRNSYEVNPDVALGSDKWLTLTKHNEAEENTISAYKLLREKGYTIVATSPHKNDCTLDELQLNQKTALVFGTELNGLSKEAIDGADTFVKIPMYGFTESFNISVSAAIVLHNLTERLRKTGEDWRLKEDEKVSILIQWMRNSIKRSDLIEQEFLRIL